MNKWKCRLKEWENSIRWLATEYTKPIACLTSNDTIAGIYTKLANHCGENRPEKWKILSESKKNEKWKPALSEENGGTGPCRKGLHIPKFIPMNSIIFIPTIQCGIVINYLLYYHKWTELYSSLSSLHLKTLLHTANFNVELCPTKGNFCHLAREFDI